MGQHSPETTIVQNGVGRVNGDLRSSSCRAGLDQFFLSGAVPAPERNHAVCLMTPVISQAMNTQCTLAPHFPYLGVSIRITVGPLSTTRQHQALFWEVTERKLCLLGPKRRR